MTTRSDGPSASRSGLELAGRKPIVHGQVRWCSGAHLLEDDESESRLLTVNDMLNRDGHRVRPDNRSDLLGHKPSVHGRTAMACMREFGNILSAYTCRGCGTEVPNKGAFKKCPVCGIKWG